MQHHLVAAIQPRWMRRPVPVLAQRQIWSGDHRMATTIATQAAVVAMQDPVSSQRGVAMRREVAAILEAD